MKVAAVGGLWPAARLSVAGEHYDGLCPRRLAKEMETVENAAQSVAMPLQLHERYPQWDRQLVQESRGGCAAWVPSDMDSSGRQRHHSWLPGQHVVAVRYLLLRRFWRRPLSGSQTETSGLGHCLKQGADLKEACHGSVLGRQTAPRAGLMALVVLFEVRVGAQCLLTSIVRRARAKRGINGDLWRRFCDARDGKPQCSILVV